MRIAITGASGNVGTALLRRLAGTGEHEIVGVSRRRPPADPPYRDVRWVCADLAVPEALDTLRTAFTGADAVVHLAWLIQPLRQRELLRRANQDGTERVATAAIEAGVAHLVHQSSIGAYSPAHGTTVDESWPTGGIPSSTYSVDKAAAERILDRMEDRLLITRMRPALIFQDDAASEIARYFLGPLVPRTLARRGLLRLAPFPDALAFQLVHADDVAAAIELALQRRPGGALNVAASPVIDRAAFTDIFGGVGPPLPAAALRVAAAATYRAHLQPTEPGWLDLAAQVPHLDPTRLEQLGWRAERDARDVLGHFVDALRRGAGKRGPLLQPGRRGSGSAA